MLRTFDVIRSADIRPPPPNDPEANPVTLAPPVRTTLPDGRPVDVTRYTAALPGALTGDATTWYVVAEPGDPGFFPFGEGPTFAAAVANAIDELDRRNTWPPDEVRRREWGRLGLVR